MADTTMEEIESLVGQGNEAMARITAAMQGITTIAEMQGISSKELEGIYALGYANYQSGKLDEAEKVFRFLVLVAQTTPKYALALGAVLQSKKQYEEAIRNYGLAALFDINVPKPHYYTAECHFLMGHFQDAKDHALALLGFCPKGTAEVNEYRAKAERLVKACDAALARK